ncbi:MAG TPA: DUF1573 domain-containing protein [Oligoflexia bacterium]|nr:DUF1573 domain-containing protein [Oligoflexia bacterium]HMP48643.1 DUF1573 domain-containing protein [Oligoflexia bacterium]
MNKSSFQFERSSNRVCKFGSYKLLVYCLCILSFFFLADLSLFAENKYPDYEDDQLNNRNSAVDSGGSPSNQLLPAIEFEKLEHDFGDVAQGLVLSQDFSIKNVGKVDLIIRKLNPSCGCTAAVLEDPVLKPGMRSAVRVTFNTAGFVGQKSKTVRVYSNDPHKSSAVLLVKANIVPEIVADPDRIDFGEIRKGEVKELSFVVKSVGQSINDSGSANSKAAPQLLFKDVISKSEFMKVESKERGPSEVGIRVLLGTQNAPLGRLRTRAVVRTSNPRVPVINIPVIADVVGDLGFEPKAINFGYVRIPLSEPPAQEIMVFRNFSADETVSIKSVASSSSAVSAEIVGSNEYGANYDSQGNRSPIARILVRLVSGNKGVERSVIKVEINHSDPGQRTMEIPVYAVLDDGSD